MALSLEWSDLAQAQAPDPPTADAAAAGLLIQQQLPALAAREQAARARVADAVAWFAGEREWAAAFPDLADAPVFAPGVLDAGLAALDEAGQRRAAERVAAPPEGLGERDQARWRDAVQAALGAEEEADGLRRRLLLGLRAASTRAPDLAELPGEASLRQEAARLAAPDAEPTQAAATRARASEAGQALAATMRLRAAANRAATIPQDDALNELVAQDLALAPAWSDDPAAQLRAEAWAERLAAVAPLLAPPLHDQVQAALKTLGEQRAAIVLPGLRTQLEAVYEELGPPTDPTQPPRPRPTDEEALVHALALAREELETRRAQVDAGPTDLSAGIDEARRKADESLARAGASSSQGEAAFRTELATAQARVADLLAAEDARHRGGQAELDRLEERASTASAEAHLALALTPLAAGRQARVDAAFLELRDLVDDLRRVVAQRRALRAESGRDGIILPSVEALPDTVRAAVESERLVLKSDLQAAREIRDQHVLVELDEALRLLALAKADRRAARVEASPQARDDVLRGFMPELRQEALEAPAVVASELRRTSAAVRALPRQATDLRVVLAFLGRSIELVVLALVWLGLRRSAEAWSMLLLSAIARANERSPSSARRLTGLGWNLNGDLRALAVPLAPVLLAAADMGLTWALFHLSRERLPPLALLILLAFARSAARAAPALLALLFSSPVTPSPSVWQVHDDTLHRARRSLRLVVDSALALAVLRFLALGIFDADRLFDLLVQLSRAWWGGVALWLLVTWEPSVRRAVASLGGKDRWSRALLASSGGLAGKVLRAAGGLILLGGRAAVELLGRVAEAWPGLGWLATALAKARLRRTDEVATRVQPLDPVALARFDAAWQTVPRPARAEELRAELLAWGEQRRRGMIAVVGDPGSGKGAMLDQAAAMAHETLSGLPIVRVQLDRRLAEPGAALAWLAEVTGAMPAGAVRSEADLPALEAALEAMTPTVFIIDDLHRLVLRAVGGFGAARVVLRVMLATCEEHLWICGLHRPTWDYLAGVGTSINLDAFRLRLVLEPIPAARLQSWAVERAAQAGLTLTFSRLVSGAPVGMDPAKAEERVAQAWFRLLADASGGNPAVAWGFLQQAMTQGPQPAQAEVRFFETPDASVLEALRDLDLFVLTAVVMHGELAGAAISEVLNAPAGQVREACRRLEGLGVLREGPLAGVDSWRVPPSWWPAVSRILRQRHFLHLR